MLVFLLLSLRVSAQATDAASVEPELNTTASLPTASEPTMEEALADPFWLEAVRHQGKAAFNANPGSYQVFRNVKVCSLSRGHVCALVVILI